MWRRCDGAGHAGSARLAAAVPFHADHLDDLPPAGDEFREGLGVGARHRARLGADAFGEQRDGLGVEPVGLGEPPRGAGEVADLARVDDRERQARAGDRRGDGELEAARGLQHDEGGRRVPQPRQ